MLDEPFSGLDPVGVDVLSGVLSEYAATGVPVVFSSHQLELVERLCEAVAIVKGRPARRERHRRRTARRRRAHGARRGHGRARRGLADRGAGGRERLARPVGLFVASATGAVDVDSDLLVAVGLSLLWFVLGYAFFA